MTAVLYVVAGIGPRTLGRQHAAQAGAARRPASCYPVVRVLGPLPRLLLAVGSVLTPDRGGREGGRRLRGGTARAWSTCWSSAG